MKKVIQRSVWLHWSAEKQNAEQAVVNVGRSEPNMQAVPLNKTKSKCIYEKSDSEDWKTDLKNWAKSTKFASCISGW